MTSTAVAAAAATRPAALPAGADPAAPLVAALGRRLNAGTDIGFPKARDIDYRPLAPLLGSLLNNVGDPGTDPLHRGHAHDVERDVLAFFADLFHAPPGWGGYITGGGTEGNLYGLWQARTRLPNAVAFQSAAAHYSVPKSLALLGMPAVTVAATATGEIDYDDLRRHAARHRGRPAIVVATIGTTMTEAVDDVARIHQALDTAGVFHRFIHSDAALAGIPLASVPDRPAFDLADGADSISISGHKFLGTPLVCGVVLTRRAPDQLTPGVGYIGSRDTTISGSRNGLAAAMLWYAVQRLGAAGFARRATEARALADSAVRQLAAIDWPAWRNPHGFTVMLRRLPDSVAARWPLPSVGDWSHIICMPGVAPASIDHLVHDLDGAATHAN